MKVRPTGIFMTHNTSVTMYNHSVRDVIKEPNIMHRCNNVQTKNKYSKKATLTKNSGKRWITWIKTLPAVCCRMLMPGIP